MIQLHSLDTLKEQLQEQEFSSTLLESSEFTIGLESLLQSGLPTPRNEEWKYFPLNSLIMTEYALPMVLESSYEPSQFQPYLQHAHHFILVNGRYSKFPSHAEISGLSLLNDRSPSTQSSFNPKDNPFPLLNALLHNDRIVLQIDEQYDASIPIHIIHVVERIGDTPVLSSPTISIQCKEGAKATIIESYHVHAVEKGLVNTSCTVDAAEHSEIQHIIIQDGLHNCALIYNCESTVSTNAKVQDHIIVHDSQKVRNTMIGTLAGEHGLYNVYGVVSANDQALIDNHTIVDHKAPHCESNELFKHVLDDASTAVFNGKIFVRLDAQKTNAYQSNRTLLLSPKATINTKPQLEIFADDVKCSHGATTGSVDEESLYYLQARGIPKEVGKRLLTEAFIGEVIQLLEVEELKSYCIRALSLESGD